MAGGIDELIDVLYGMVEEAWSVPLGRDKCIIEREKVLDILDELRGNLPGEIKAAREIVEKRNDLLAAGKKEADSLKRTAEERAKALVEQSEIVTAAAKRAKEITAAAEAQAAELKRAANVYCDDLMRRTDETVSTFLTEVRKLREDFKSAAGMK
ncbi:MAG: hypothetical protein GX929_04765 [Clostridiales bacterium]|jgi:cell division septum initiation protein DivIVA|nr:hypothetical protein [Clostridiales bacterium]